MSKKKKKSVELRRTAQGKKAVLEALVKSLGIVTSACRTAGIPRRTFYAWFENDKEFAAEVRDISEIALDFAESELFQQIKKGSLGAICFFLKCKGKRRGWVERQEITGADGDPVGISAVNVIEMAREVLKTESVPVEKA